MKPSRWDISRRMVSERLVAKRMGIEKGFSSENGGGGGIGKIYGKKNWQKNPQISACSFRQLAPPTSYHNEYGMMARISGYYQPTSK